MKSFVQALLNFDVDTYLNPYIPANPVAKLPRIVAHFLGHRQKPSSKINNVLIWIWSFVGAFCGIALIEAVYRYSSILQSWDPPVVIGSFGAAAILEYNTIESPLAQPRNLVFGQFFSAVVGVAITKLFLLLPSESFEDLRWLAGALAVGVSSFVMGITKTVHPPAGATALLAATDAGITKTGWYLLPLVLIGCALMLASACIIDNVQRQFPQYWWSPGEVGEKLPRLHPKGASSGTNSEDSLQGCNSEKNVQDSNMKDEMNAAEHLKRSSSAMSQHLDETKNEYTSPEPEIRITKKRIYVPDWLELDDWQKEILRILQGQLKQGPSDESYEEAV